VNQLCDAPQTIDQVTDGARRRVVMVAQTAYPNDVRVRRAGEALQNAGYDVDVVCIREPDTAPAIELIKGVRAIRLPITRRRGSRLRYVVEYASFFTLACAAVSLLHIRRKYDLVHVHTLPDALVFAGLPARLLGARILLDMHDPMPDLLASKYGLSDRHPLVWLATRVEQAAVGFADQVVTVHEPIRQLFIRRGAPPDKIGIVMNLVDQADFPRRATPPDSAAGRFIVIYAGLIAARYGLDLALHAVDILRNQIPGLLLRIVGRGDYLIELRQLAHKLDLEAQVEFIPEVPHAEVRRLLQDADVGISPHRPEIAPLSLSNKLYEYVAVGIPAVASRTDCLEHYYPENVVRFFTPGDAADLARAILHLYHSPEERHARITAGWQLTDRWNWQQERARFVSIVDGLLDKRSRSVSRL
jgi:glycosyltransferase involved in cell wall biosynthesis